MNIATDRAVRAFAVPFLITLVACGDDETPKGAGGDAAVDGGGTGRLDAGPLPDGAVPGQVGFPCAVDEECGEGLACVANTVPGFGDQLFGFCGTRCTGNSGCASGEVCISTARVPDDLHCVKLEHEEYAECGPLVAAVCDGRTCLFPSDLPVGYCVDLCTIGGSGDDAGVEDAGTGETLTCRSAGQACIEDILSDPTLGLCGEYVARGETCRGSEGRFCVEGDVCTPVDAEDPASELRCHESCATSACSEGSCVTLGGLAYCQ